MEQAVIAIIFDTSRENVLAVQRRDVTIWVLPGGKVDEGETFEEAAIREVMEETGLTVSIKKKVGTYTPKQITKTITHVYECLVVSGSPQITSEVRNIGFFPINNLPKLFFIIHETWIQEALKNLPEPIERTLDELNWWSFSKFILQHPICFGRFFLSKMLGITLNS